MGAELPPRRGMLGPVGPDEFPVFDGKQMPARRSEIDDFGDADALSVLDGDLSSTESRMIATMVRNNAWSGKLPHGGHRHGTGWGKDEFPPGWGPPAIIMWVRSISDSPSGGRVTAAGFEISGSAFGVGGVLAIHHDGYGNWWIATTIPVSWEA